MVEPQDPAAQRAWREILEILFSPGDAALAARLPVVPTTVEDLARRTGMDAAGLRTRLDAMAGKGLVLDLRDPRSGATTYMLAPPVVGFFELSMMRLNDGLPKERLARAYEAYMGDDRSFDEEVAGSPTLVSRTLVQETALFDDLLSEVLDWDRATAYVENAGVLAVSNCFCRHVAEHLGTACDYPMETCMSLGTAARYLVRHGYAREIGRAEGRELLESAREQGLVHIADNVQQELNYICSCCSCCCVELRSARMGMPVMQPSAFQPTADDGLCTGCGKCVRACPVQAISLVARGPGRGDGDKAAARLLCERRPRPLPGLRRLRRGLRPALPDDGPAPAGASRAAERRGAPHQAHARAGEAGGPARGRLGRPGTGLRQRRAGGDPQAAAGGEAARERAGAVAVRPFRAGPLQAARRVTAGSTG